MVNVLCIFRAMMGLAAVLRNQGELNQARRLYEQALAVAPRGTHALTIAARIKRDSR